jgi:hypothetical protein
LRRLQIAQIALFASSLIAVMCLSPGAASVLPRGSTQDEENPVKDLKMRGAVLAAAVLLGGAQSAVAQSAPIEWPVSAGGNGHWYADDNRPFFEPFAARQASYEAIGAHLATVTSQAEHQFVLQVAFPNGQLLPQDTWPALGAYKPAGSVEFSWVTGESTAYWPFSYETKLTHPQWLMMWGSGLTPLLIWTGNGNTVLQRSIVEWSADCDQNGLVDFGEIRRGEKADANMNNIPDCCEEPAGCCPGDIDGDDTTDGIDLAIVLARWGTNPKDYPKADANSDGVVDGQDLSVVLNGWGSCQ